MNKKASENFSILLESLKTVARKFPDKRTGKNSVYSMEDITLSAFSLFFLQSPSFLKHQALMQKKKGTNNAFSLFDIDKIPSDNHIRDTLDYVSEKNLDPIFRKAFDILDSNNIIEDYRFLDNQLLIAVDGTQVFSSKKINCKKCFKTNHKEEDATFSHKVITPVIVKPGKPQVISLEPEFISPQDGSKKQDHELKAVNRWINKYGKFYSEKQATLLGDDLYSNHPFCEKALDAGFNFILTCKPSSHKIMYETLDMADAVKDIKEYTYIRKKGNKKEFENYRYYNKILIRDGNDKLRVNWCEIIVKNKEGSVLYKNNFITNFVITNENIPDIVEAGRARWKVENENNNTLKRGGYNLEHSFGHGKEHLANLFTTFNILAFLFHTVLDLCDYKYKKIRDCLKARYTFFEHLRIIVNYVVFKNWEHMMSFIIKELEIEVLDTS